MVFLIVLKEMAFLGSSIFTFVIPALNEEKCIADTVKSIHRAMTMLCCGYQVVVVDHGSSDGTRGIAESVGAEVFRYSGGTISSLRNYGASKASGEILVFIDADVTLTDEWIINIKSVMPDLLGNKKLITGSHCSPPSDSNLFNKYWFSALALDPRNTHLGTGHLMINRKNFIKIGGFSERLETGEDYEFCRRAYELGFSVVNNPDLRVIHHDFPRRPVDFIRREAWHSRGDLTNLRSAIHSKVVLASLVFIVLHLMLICALVLGSIALFSLSIFMIIGLLIFSSFVKNVHFGWKSVFINSGIFYFYYLGRSLGILRRLCRQ